MSNQTTATPDNDQIKRNDEHVFCEGCLRGFRDEKDLEGGWCMNCMIRANLPDGYEY